MSRSSGWERTGVNVRATVFVSDDVLVGQIELPYEVLSELKPAEVRQVLYQQVEALYRQLETVVLAARQD